MPLQFRSSLRRILAVTATAALVALGLGAAAVQASPVDTVAVAEPATALEGSSITFAVTLTGPGPVSGPASIGWALENDSARAGEDYNGPAGATSGSLTFPPGGSPQTMNVIVSTVNDTAGEPVESFRFVLDPNSGETCDPTDDCTATGTIAADPSDGPVPAVSVSSTGTVDETAGFATFTVTRSGTTTAVVRANWAASETGADPATPTTDFGPPFTGEVEIQPATNIATILIPIDDDEVDEANETFKVVLTSATNATIGTASATISIIDNDASPDLSISNHTVAEGTGGVTTAAFAVTLSKLSEQEVTVTASTSPGTASAGTDYTTKTEVLTIPPGEISEVFTVNVVADARDEADTETFTVNLAGATGASIVDGAGNGDITDDDAPPSLTIADRQVTEGNSGTSNMTFTVTKLGLTDRTVTVNFTTVNGTATEPSDYTETMGALTFTPVQTTQTFVVPIVGDIVTEPPTETFTVELSGATNATIGDAEATGTIVDNDGPPALTIDDESGDEEDAPMTFTVSLTNPSATPVVVSYATAEGTARAVDSDYSPAAGSVSFDPGDTSETIEVDILEDALDEVNETFTVVLASPVGATIADGSGQGTIVDDDDPPAVSISDVSANEGDAGTTSFDFTVTLSSASAKTVTVKVDDVAGSATPGTDYVAFGLTTVTFGPGEVSKPVSVSVNGDTSGEVDETFTLRLTAPTNATLDDDSGTGTIRNDDGAPPTIDVNDPVAVTEGNAGEVDVTFTVTVNDPNGEAVTVEYRTADGTAAAPGDYTALPATLLSFGGAETSKTVTVKVKGDVLDELNSETFLLSLGKPSNASFVTGGDSGTGTITDDDSVPVLRVAGPAPVGEADNTSATFNVTLSPVSGRTVTVEARTANGSAEAGSDYETAEATLTFPAGTTFIEVPVAIINDAFPEATESFNLGLSNPSNATIAADGTTASAIITDSDPALPVASVDDVGNIEGRSVIFTVTLSGPAIATTNVAYKTTNATAVAPDDFDVSAGSVVFATGQTTKTITVALKTDGSAEGDEVFALDLLSADFATIDPASGSGVGLIVDSAYALAASDGNVYTFGLTNRGGMAGRGLNQPIIGIALTPSGNGYWLVAKDGGIFSFGDAAFFGSMGDKRLNAPVLGMEPTPTGKGYWLFAQDGGIFTFGDAFFFGSTGDMRLNAPVIGMEAEGDGSGYWLVAQDGGIFSFNAPFFGSTGSLRLNQPVFDMAAVSDSTGYWLVARDGGIFTFGPGMGFFGSAVGRTTATVVGIGDTATGEGYWVIDARGLIIAFGDAVFLGDVRDRGLTNIVGFASLQ